MHPCGDELEMYVYGRLGETEVAAIETHLVGCEGCLAQLSNTVELFREVGGLKQPLQNASSQTDRRNEPRFRTNTLASIQVLTPLTLGRSSVRIIDVSKGGLKLWSGEPVSPGTIIQVRLKGTFILGEVRYCVSVRDCFQLGVQIQDVV